MYEIFKSEFGKNYSVKEKDYFKLLNPKTFLRFLKLRKSEKFTIKEFLLIDYVLDLEYSYSINRLELFDVCNSWNNGFFNLHYREIRKI